MNKSTGRPNIRHSRWQTGFLSLLPRIERILMFEFRRLNPHDREEAVQNSIALSLVAYSRLHAQGRPRVANAWSLARYAALQHRGGRIAGGHLNDKDAMSSYAAMRHGIRLQRYDGYESQSGTWINDLVEDALARVHDIVAARVDMREWLATLGPRTRKVAADLAKGYSTAETAAKHCVSAGRISQMRRELESSWRSFQCEPALI
jgi:hypothetical protein